MLSLLLDLGSVLSIGLGLYLMVSISRKVKPILRRLDELKKYEDRLIQWELDHIAWEGDANGKLELSRGSRWDEEGKELPF